MERQEPDAGKNRKCIVCNNTGGTIFSDINGTLKAQCGNKSNPCNLQIEIRKGKIINLEDLPIESDFRNAWSADFSEPDGYGMNMEEYYEKLHNELGQ